MATPMMSTYWYWMLMPTRRNWPLICGLTVRCTVGDQTTVAMPVRITIRPRVTMTGRSAEAPWSRRMSTRSTNAPEIDAPRIRTISRAAQVGWWWADTSSQ